MNRTDYYIQAKRLHNQVPVVDAHNDLAGELLYRHRHGETHVIERLYLPHLKAAHFKLIISSIYVENSVFFPETSRLEESSGHRDWNDYLNQNALIWEQGFQNARNQIAVLKQEINQCPQELQLVTSVADLDLLLQNDKTGILIYMEGLDCIGSDLHKLDELYALGVRGASLTWSRRNRIATGCCMATKQADIAGLITDYGFQVIRHMQELGMFLDVSHLNNQGFAQLTDIPFIATHSNAFSVCANYRNLTDDQMKHLADQGGIMGVNACKYIASNGRISLPAYGASAEQKYRQKERCLDSLCRHIEYIVKTIGDSHVGFGFDLCDSYTAGKAGYADIPHALRAAACGEASFEPEDCLEHHEEALLLTARLLERGISEESMLRIMGSNWWNYLHAQLPNPTHPFQLSPEEKSLPQD